MEEVSVGPPALTADTLKAVNKLWAEAKEERPGELSDGSIFNISDLDWPTIRGHFIAYKVLFAYRSQSALFPDLRIRPLAVTGVCHCSDGILFGKRSNRVAQDQGLWEFAPSGGLDSSSRGHDGGVDFSRQLAREFAEETGLSSEMISDVKPHCVAEDESNQVFDIVAHLTLNGSPKEIERALSLARNEEYESFKVVKVDDIENFKGARLGQMAPLTQFLINEAKLFDRPVR